MGKYALAPRDGIAIFDGDSLTYGYASAGVRITQPYPTQCIALCTASGRTLGYTNLGVNNQTIVQMLANAAAKIDILYNAGYTRNIVVCFGGVNDLATDTPATVYANQVLYCSGRKTVGFLTVLCTIPSANPASIPGFDALRNTLNGLILAGFPGNADVIARLDTEPHIGPDGSYADTTYYQTDQIHWKNAGATDCADAVKNAIMFLP